MSDLPTELVEMDARALPLGFANGSVTSVRIVGSTLCRWCFQPLEIQFLTNKLGNIFHFRIQACFSRSVETANLVLGWLCSYKFCVEEWDCADTSYTCTRSSVDIARRCRLRFWHWNTSRSAVLAENLNHQVCVIKVCGYAERTTVNWIAWNI